MEINNKMKIVELHTLIKSSFELNKHLFNKSFNEINDELNESLNQIFKFSPTIISGGVSEDGCIFIYAEINNKHIYYNLFFDDERGILLNIMENKSPICYFYGSLEESICKLNEICS